MEHVGNKSICEIFVKILTDVVLKDDKPPGIEKESEEKIDNNQP